MWMLIGDEKNYPVLLLEIRTSVMELIRSFWFT